MNLAPYDDELIEECAWRLAQADGFEYGRCGIIDDYRQRVVGVVVGLEAACEAREADALCAWTREAFEREGNIVDV